MKEGKNVYKMFGGECSIETINNCCIRARHFLQDKLNLSCVPRLRQGANTKDKYGFYRAVGETLNKH
jgi:hypothetical protein